MDRLFPEWALEWFRAQWSHNTAYRRFVDASGVRPDAVTDWKRIPAVPTTAFKELELTSLAPGDRTRVFHSSGTTGQRPSRHFHGAGSLRVYEASLESGFELGFWRGREARGTAGAAGVGPWSGWMPVSLTPPPDSVPHSSLVHMIDRVGRRCRGGGTLFSGRVNAQGAWDLDLDLLVDALLACVDRNEAVVLFGTAFGFVHLVEGFDRRGLSLRLPGGSRVMETGGYKGRTREWDKAELRACLSRCLGVSESDIVGEYGMSELSSQAYELPARTGTVGASGRGFVFPPWARPLVIAPETGKEAAEGQPGLLRVIDLANVWSVAAVQTEDRVVNREGAITWLGRAPAAEPRGCSLMAAAEPGAW